MPADATTTTTTTATATATATASPASPPRLHLLKYLGCRGEHVYARPPGPGAGAGGAPAVDFLFGPCPLCAAEGSPARGGEQRQEGQQQDAGADEGGGEDEGGARPSFYFCFRGDALHFPGLRAGAWDGATGVVRRGRAGAEDFAAWRAREAEEARVCRELQAALSGIREALRALEAEEGLRPLLLPAGPRWPRT